MTAKHTPENARLIAAAYCAENCSPRRADRNITRVAQMTRAERLAAYGVAHPNAEELDALDECDWLRVLRTVRHEWEARQVGRVGAQIGAPQHTIQESRRVLRVRHLEEIKCSR